MKNEKTHQIKSEKDNGTIFIFKKKQQLLKIKIKYLNISLIVFFKRGFARLGSVLHFFFTMFFFFNRTISKKKQNLKKSQKKTKSFNFSGKKQKTRNKQENNKKKTNKLTQPYNNFAEASGTIAAQLSAVIIFPCVVKC